MDHAQDFQPEDWGLSPSERKCQQSFPKHNNEALFWCKGMVKGRSKVLPVCGKVAATCLFVLMLYDSSGQGSGLLPRQRETVSSRCSSRIYSVIMSISTQWQVHRNCPMRIHFSAARAQRKTVESSMMDQSVKLLSVCSRSMGHTLQIGSKFKKSKLLF